MAFSTVQTLVMNVSAIVKVWAKGFHIFVPVCVCTQVCSMVFLLLQFFEFLAKLCKTLCLFRMKSLKVYFWHWVCMDITASYNSCKDSFTD